MRTTDFIINELRFIIDDLGRFPTQREIAKLDKTKVGCSELVGKSKLISKINQNGGINQFRKLMGYPLVNQPWNEERAIKELSRLIKELGHYPATKELRSHSLRQYISGKTNYYRRKLGYEVIRIREVYSEEYIIDKINSIIKETGEFPVLDLMKDEPYFSRIFYYGGVNHFRKVMGYKLSREQWNEEKFITELSNAVDEFGRFPTQTDLINKRNHSLLNAINNRGGFIKTRDDFSNIFPDSVSKNYRSELMSYIGKRGANSEKIVKELITEWCYAHNLPQPEFDVKLSKGNIIEFVCESNSRIGIDVTNTKNRGGHAIRHKWNRKEYHLHLDELWIVVFSDVYTEHDYFKFNKQSPDNVKVMSIEVFMEELQISVDKDLQLKIENYNTCDFHSKDDFSHPKLGLSKFFKIKPDNRIKSEEVKADIDKNQKV